MRLIARFASEFLLGMVVKSRLIMIFMVLAVAALIWVDRYTRGLAGFLG